MRQNKGFTRVVINGKRIRGPYLQAHGTWYLLVPGLITLLVIVLTLTLNPKP